MPISTISGGTDMPKKEETEAASVAPGVMELLELLANKIDPAKTIVEFQAAQGKPTQAQLQKKAEEKWRREEEEEQRKAAKEAKQKACGHVHPDSGRSRMFKVHVGEQQSQTGRFPKGAGMMICSYCFYKLTNYEITHKKVPIAGGFHRTAEEVRLINNLEFDQWFSKPTVSQGTMFGA